MTKSDKITFADTRGLLGLFGDYHKNITRLAKATRTTIHVRGNTVSIEGDGVDRNLVKKTLTQLHEMILEGYPVYEDDIDFAVGILSKNDRIALKDIFLDTVYITGGKKAITPKNVSQKEYIDAMRKHDMVFGIGPAGTGKTYLAMAMAVAALKKNAVRRIILTRPAVEAGEALGFLPGNLAEKVDPYLRPLYDALHDMMRFEKATRLMEQGVIEVAPIAYMRGRTLNDAFVILDEAQNTTREQMKMFLTRIGFNSKAVITGDITQIDLTAGNASGLVEAKDILAEIPGICIKYFDKEDVVRHKLVQDVIAAYETLEAKRTNKPDGY